MYSLFIQLFYRRAFQPRRYCAQQGFQPLIFARGRKSFWAIVLSKIHRNTSYNLPKYSRKVLLSLVQNNIWAAFREAFVTRLKEPTQYSGLDDGYIEVSEQYAHTEGGARPAFKDVCVRGVYQGPRLLTELLQLPTFSRAFFTMVTSKYIQHVM